MTRTSGVVLSVAGLPRPASADPWPDRILSMTWLAEQRLLDAVEEDVERAGLLEVLQGRDRLVRLALVLQPQERDVVLGGLGDADARTGQNVGQGVVLDQAADAEARGLAVLGHHVELGRVPIPAAFRAATILPMLASVCCAGPLEEGGGALFLAVGQQRDAAVRPSQRRHGPGSSCRRWRGSPGPHC